MPVLSNKKITFFSVLMVAIIFGLGAAGCGNNVEPTDQGHETAASARPEETAAPLAPIPAEPPATLDTSTGTDTNPAPKPDVSPSPDASPSSPQALMAAQALAGGEEEEEMRKITCYMGNQVLAWKDCKTGEFAFENGQWILANVGKEGSTVYVSGPCIVERQ